MNKTPFTNEDLRTITKKVVRYKKGTLSVSENRKFAMLFPINHPDRSRVSNTKFIITSRPVRFDESAEILETENTLYVPFKEELIE